MPMFRTTPRATPRRSARHHHTTTTTTTTRTKPTLMGRLRGQRAVHHQKRKATLGDKVSGALLKLKGSLTHRPGEKAAGTRRMHGTDGRGQRKTRRVY